jgi:hypothetical protein
VGGVSRACGHELGLELVLGHAGLLRADVLHVQAEDAGKLGQVVGVAAGGDELQHVARGMAARCCSFRP